MSVLTRRKSRPRDLFDAFDQHDFSLGTCFLCGLRLDASSRSDEHVFPQWLLRRCDLYNKQLNLLNGTGIPYRQLTIPCCRICNNNHLSAMEREVRSVIEGRRPLAAWMRKLSICGPANSLRASLPRGTSANGPSQPLGRIDRFRRRNATLPHDACVSAGRPSPDQLSVHARAFPASVFAFKVQEPKTLEARFDFRDDVRFPALFMRLGPVGILAAFDAGPQAYEWGPLYWKYRRYRLHPLQLEDLGAAMFCKASLFDRVPKLIVSGDRRHGYEIMIMPLAGLSTRPVFAAWDGAVFAEFLSAFTGMPVEHLTPDGGRQVMTFMKGNGSNRFKAMDIRQHPYRGIP
jgi:hypothetical protein